MLLHCWACRLTYNQLHILRVVAAFVIAISHRTRAVVSLQSVISLLPSWPDGKTVHSLPHGSKFNFRSLFAYYHEPTGGASARPGVRWACRLSWPDFPPRTPYCIDFSIQHSSRTPLSATFSLQHSLSPCDHFQCYLLDSVFQQRRKHSFFLGRSQSKWTHFSGIPQLVELLPEITLRFLTYTGKSRSSLVSSARFNVITIALSTTLPALSRVTYTPCLCFPILASLFLFGMTVPEPNQFRQHDPIPHLRNCTPKLPLRPAPCTGPD